MIRKLIKHRAYYLAGLAVLTATAGFFAAQVEVEQNNESMNSLSQAELTVHDELREVFGEDEDLIVAYRAPGLRSEAGVRALGELTARFERIPGVRRVYSLTNAIELVPGRDGVEEHPLLPPLGGADFEARLEAALERNPELAGFLIGRDANTAGLLVELEYRPDDSAYRRVVVDSLRGIAKAPADRDARIHFTGIVAQKYEVSRLLVRDQSVLIPVSVVVLGVVLLLFFRSVAGVALPLLVTGTTLVLTLGLYRLFGFALNTMTSLLPLVLMVLSVSTSVHLLEHWRRNVSAYTDAPSAIAGTVRALRFPCTLTSVTTALGMASLAVSATPAVQTFGTFTAIGVLISLCVSLTLVPVGLSFLSHPSSVDPGPFARALDPALRAASRLSRARPRTILGVALGLTIAAVVGTATIRNNTDLVRFLKITNRLYVDTLAVEEHLSGVNAIELVVSRWDGAPLDTVETTRRLVALRTALVDHSRVADVKSVLDVLRAIHRAQSDSGRTAFGVDTEGMMDAWDVLSAVGDSDLVRRLVDDRFGRVRLRILLHAIGSADAAPVEDWILSEAARILGDAYRVDVTGSFHQVIRDSNRLVATQLASFATALGLVLLAIGVMLGSFRLMIYSLIPNIVPVVWTGGLMGLLRIDLSTGTAMIASVVIGIAVDDTIHYLTRFRRERDAGVGVAIDRTTTQTGRALVMSSIVLAIGFWVGALGSFKPTIYFSLLTGLTMLSALLCDLLVLPASLMLGSSSREVRR